MRLKHTNVGLYIFDRFAPVFMYYTFHHRMNFPFIELNCVTSAVYQHMHNIQIKASYDESLSIYRLCKYRTKWGSQVMRAQEADS
jgi:hypothetical protein